MSYQSSKNYGRRFAILGTRGIPAQYGGFETFAEELATRLTRRGIEVTVFCEGNRKDGPSDYSGIRLEYAPAPRIGPLTTLLFDLRCLWYARKDYDIVYMLGYGASIFCFLPRLWGTKVWINMDGVEWARSKWGRSAKLWFKLMEAAAMWTADRIICDARGILSHLGSRHKHMPPVSVIPYGAPVLEEAPDAVGIAEWSLTSGGYYLMVCRLEPENSVQEIVKGFLKSEARYPLIVVGCVEPATNYVKEILKMNNGRIRFIGPVYDKQKLQALRYHASAYFHGHTVGGTNPSLLEALGCGNVVIVHNNRFNREVAGEAAVYFHQGKDIPAIIRSVESYTIEQRTWRKRAAQQRIRKIYSWDIVTMSYYGLINSYFRIQERARSQWQKLLLQDDDNKQGTESPVLYRDSRELAMSQVSERINVA
jgi:glycosyltransferase involved in cell wall biosynthesis